MIIDKFIEEKYLTTKCIKTGSVVTGKFLDEGVIIKQVDGWEKLQFTVLIDGKEKLYTPNFRSRKNISDAYSSDTSKWVGKEFTINLSNKNGKESIIAYPNVV